MWNAPILNFFNANPLWESQKRFLNYPLCFLCGFPLSSGSISALFLCLLVGSLFFSLFHILSNCMLTNALVHLLACWVVGMVFGWSELSLSPCWHGRRVCYHGSGRGTISAGGKSRYCRVSADLCLSLWTWVQLLILCMPESYPPI